eukprot:c41424_g1_i1 orf=118-273(-)
MELSIELLSLEALLFGKALGPDSNAKLVPCQHGNPPWTSLKQARSLASCQI